MISYEAWHGCKMAVSHLRVFDCLVFTKELGYISKLDDRSTLGVLIGYVEGSKAYHIVDLGTQRVHTTWCLMKGEDGHGIRRWTTARLQRR